MAALTKRSYITTLVYLSRYCTGKPFRDMTRQDIIDGYLASLRRGLAGDPDERWINTYKARAARISAFFKWLTQPDEDAAFQI
jgi:hypothetical protein